MSGVPLKKSDLEQSASARFRRVTADFDYVVAMRRFELLTTLAPALSTCATETELLEKTAVEMLRLFEEHKAGQINRPGSRMEDVA